MKLIGWQGLLNRESTSFSNYSKTQTHNLKTFNSLLANEQLTTSKLSTHYSRLTTRNLKLTTLKPSTHCAKFKRLP